MQIVLITGISGSGKSVALNALEDAGFFCVDNLPPELLPELVRNRMRENSNRLAVAVDSRSASSLSSLPGTINDLKEAGYDVHVFFLTCDTNSLIIRFSETRRSHPLSHKMHPTAPDEDNRTLIEAIRAEREMLADIQDISNVIDTSNSRANDLRNRIKQLVNIRQAPLILQFESFGFKYGVPLDSDLVFDVRMLPNPYYDTTLRSLTGKDEPVKEYLRGHDEVGQLLNDIQTFIEKWLPTYQRDNRSYLTIAIGCTGGQHRSVYLIEQLAAYFSQKHEVVVRHRELPSE